MDNEFVIEKWVNRWHFFIDEKSLQKFRPTGEFSSVCPYYMILFFFSKSIFGVTTG